MKAKGRQGKWESMTARELAGATSEFDKPGVIDRSKPLTTAERDRWRAAKRKRGRPRVGKGARAVSVTIEAGLLQRTDQLARKLGVTRAQLIARGLIEVLKAG